MARGNQRELARQKNVKKQQELKKAVAANNKDGNKGLTLEERRLRDADQMRLKQQKALEKKQQAAA
ncbi:UNVERIFIED_CONTAM: SERF-like protein [Trichonephila clavipes]